MAQAITPTRRSQTAAQILAAFQGEIEPVRPTALYKLWILIVTGMMILLPLLYVALIALVGYAVAWHAGHNITRSSRTSATATATANTTGPCCSTPVP